MGLARRTAAIPTATATATPQEQRIALHAGWNWVSFATMPSEAAAPMPVGEALASIAGQYDLVLGETAPVPRRPRASSSTRWPPWSPAAAT